MLRQSGAAAAPQGWLRKREQRLQPAKRGALQSCGRLPSHCGALTFLEPKHSQFRQDLNTLQAMGFPAHVDLFHESCM